jgi:hypothetical protein
MKLQSLMEPYLIHFTPVLLTAALLILTPRLAQATITLCLDFNGHHIHRWHDNSFDLSDVDIPAFNRPGSSSATLDATEKSAVDKISAMVAEDYAPFNIDIVTDEPPLLEGTDAPPRCPSELPKGAGVRVVIGGHSSDFQSDFHAGGYAIGHSFLSGDPDEPNVVLAFAYNDSNTNLLPTEKLAHEASHEAGHAFGLWHQAQYDQNGDFIYEYEPGNLDMSPIMGDHSLRVGGGFAETPLRTTWWLGPTTFLVDKDGHPVHADKRPAFIQDDMQMLASLLPADLPDLYNCTAPDSPDDCTPHMPNGFGYRRDDHGDIAGSASPMKQIRRQSHLEATGLIEQPSDVDYFSFVVPGGALAAVGVVASVFVAQDGPNLNAMVEICDYAGTHVYASGGGSGDGRLFLNARASAALPPGEYRLRVGGHGDPGDVGRYRVDLAINSGPKIVGHVLFDDRIRVTFNEKIEPSTFDETDSEIVKIKGGDGITIPQRNIRVVPVSYLARTYDVLFPRYATSDGIQSWIGPNITNLRHQRMDQNGDGQTNLDDRYDRALDLTGPQVSRVGLATDHLEILFDEAVNPATVNTNTIRLFDPSGAATMINAPVQIDDNHFEIPIVSYPVGGLALEIGPDVHDAFGNPMGETYRLQEIDPQGPRVADAAYLDNEYLPGYGTVRQSAVLIAFDEVIAADSLASGGNYNVSIVYRGDAQEPSLIRIPVSISDVSSYNADGFQGGGTDRLWVVGFHPKGFGTYELTVNTQVTDLFHNPLNQDGDAVNGEVPQDRYRFRFEIQPNSGTTQLELSDAYRLAGRMVWGDEWLLEHLPIQQEVLSNPVPEHDPFQNNGAQLDPQMGADRGFEDGSVFK